jgi:hypothetical protein
MQVELDKLRQSAVLLMTRTQVTNPPSRYEIFAQQKIDCQDYSDAIKPYCQKMLYTHVRPEPLKLKNPCREILLDGHHRFNAFIVTGKVWPQYINSDQVRYLIRHLYIWAYPIHKDTPYIMWLGHNKLNRLKYQKYGRKIDTPAYHVLAAFYSKMFHQWATLRYISQSIYEDSEFADEFVKILYDAIGPNDKLDMKYRTGTVMSLIRTMRQTEDFSAMPILADALEEEGFPNRQLLDHYRTSKNFSLGSWIFTKAGVL